MGPTLPERPRGRPGAAALVLGLALALQPPGAARSAEAPSGPPPPPPQVTAESLAAALPRLTAFPLTSVSGDTFRYQPGGENADGPSAVSFTVGADGRTTAVRIDNLNLEGQGVLQRR
ncbi:hypothetical protein KBZ12_10405 [Cyanobium sp. Cruz CV13-4-11]|uniref:hypothetical protein n=1 Tax=unclassified Cyanobium TaxID=2627006 RepID=UPI0020CC6EC1|nr:MULTISPECIES: hypothetical protein [unclassified Cyanobium]MCP9900793.1 hypothetical protein [Cyanobium sp. Cruz CV11-17]MCP9919885.1 hypothetical protein [Cyanobium sp. Cruz CV13-4-11]